MEVSREEIRKFEATGRVGLYEKEYLRKDGTRQWLIFAGRSLGENACVEFCVDISDRKRAEAALRFSEARFRMLCEHANDGIMLAESNGHILSANPAACKLFGLTEAQLCGPGENPLASTGDLRLAVLLADRTQQGSAAGEVTFSRRDGSRFDAEVSSVVCQSDEGPRTSIIIHDVTDRRQRERQIREQAALLDKADEAIVASDLNGDITFWSQGAERMFGWSAAEMLGQTVTAVFTRGGVAAGAEVFHAFAREADWRGEVNGHNRAGKPWSPSGLFTRYHILADAW